MSITIVKASDIVVTDYSKDIYVDEEHDIVVLNEEGYWLSLKQVDTKSKLLETVYHLCEKVWMDTQRLQYFIELVAEQNGINIFNTNDKGATK